jgi:hypothetical protein
MNKAKRYVCRQILHTINVMLEVLYHELWRVVNVEADGMTQKEHARAQRLLSDLRNVSDGLSLLGQDLQR